jgi:hypothetical protein
VDNEVTQTGVEVEQRPSRRGIIAAGVGGAALSLLPFLGGRADAAATTTTEGTPSTTAPPKRPTADDTALLGAAQQVELTTLALYDQAIGKAKGWTPEQATLMTTLREAHHAFANAISGLLGRVAPNGPNETILAQRGSKFTGNSGDVLLAAADLESSLVATHLDVLAKLQGVNGAALVASILSSEARHVTALRDLGGVTDLSALLVDTEADSLLGNG